MVKFVILGWVDAGRAPFCIQSSVVLPDQKAFHKVGRRQRRKVQSILF
jgi:hypothetical protein